VVALSRAAFATALVFVLTDSVATRVLVAGLSLAAGIPIASVSHVLLEFPLNHVTFMAIGRELRDVAGARKLGPSPS
jgi:hypothetical protein